MNHPLASHRVLLAIAATVLTGCGTESAAGPGGPTPLVSATTVEAGPYNALSVLVRTAITGADSVRVRFGVKGDGLDSSTPMVGVAGDTIQLPVLGLLAETTYRFRVVAYHGTESAQGTPVEFTTGQLPVDLPAYVTSGADPSPGFVAFGAYPWGVVIDNTGRVVWYRRIESGPALNFQVEPTGHYATSPITPDAGDPTPWTVYDPAGAVVRRLGCVGGLVTRFHELRLDPDGGAWLMCDQTRILNLSLIGGNPSASVTATVVQHLDASGALTFQWNAFDHFLITDLDSVSRSGPVVNFTHGNALDFDAAGHLLLSFRSLNEITSIDTATGAVRWRMGGRANQFSLQGGALPFIGQHGLRVIGPRMLQFLDNRGLPGDSRGLRWEVDEAAHTATYRGSFSAPPPVEAQLGGSTQMLPGGRILVAYGNAHRVQEYDAAGNVVWQIEDDPGYVFRATRITSLYRP